MEGFPIYNSANLDPLDGVALDLPPPRRRGRKVGHAAMADVMIAPNLAKKAGRKKRGSTTDSETLVENAREDFRREEQERRAKQARRATRER